MSGTHDWRLVPIATAAWAGAWLGTWNSWQLPVGFLLLVAATAGFVAGVHALRATSWTATAVLTLVVIAVISGMRSTQLHTSAPAQWAAQGAVARAVVEVVGDPRPLPRRGSRPELVVARATLRELDVWGHIVRTAQPVALMASGEAAADLVEAAPGSRHEVTGSLRPSEPSAPEALLVRVHGIHRLVREPGVVDHVVNRLREGLRRAAAHSPPKQAALLPSLVVGDTSGIDEDLTESFRVTSLSHLLAVSGANLTLLLGVVLTVVRHAGVRGWAVRVIALACVGFFVVLCRSEPSVVRAAAMGLVALAAMGSGTGRRSVRHLAVAVVGLMLLDPWLARSWGFALSVSACAGIAAWVPGWTAALATWLPRWMAEATALPLAAQLATQPLVTALNGQVSLVGVAANMAAGPFVGPATVLGMTATVLTFAPPLAAGVAWAAGWLVQPIIWIAETGARLPGASLPWPASSLGVALVTLGSLVLAAGAPVVLSRPIAVIGTAAALVAATGVQPAPLGWPGPWQAVFCDVGQGDATVLRAGAHSAVLVDAGPEAAATMACLRGLGVRNVPLVVLTHFHADHVGGAEAVIARYRPTTVLVSPWEEPAAAASGIRAAAARVGAEIRVAGPGLLLDVGDVQVTVIGAQPPAGHQVPSSGESAGENNASVMAVAEVAALRLLLPGDAEPEAQRQSLAHADSLGVGVAVDVLKLPHHGSARQDGAFFQRSEAAVAVVSAGADNDYGHPARDALRLAASHGMRVVRTDQEGSIALTRTAAGVEVRTGGR